MKTKNKLMVVAMMVGVFLCPQAEAIHVDDNYLTPVNDSCNNRTGIINDPYCKIQDAVNAAQDGDIVLVYNGIYKENVDFLGKAITVKSENGPDVTTIDGSNPPDSDKGSVITFASGENSDSLLSGFTITGGSGRNLFGEFYGGGIYCEGSSPVITGCIITANTVVGYFSDGGGIYSDSGSSPTIINCTVTGNSAGDYGGGIYCSGSATIVNCTVSGNSADFGAGVGCGFGALPVIINCTITGNKADSNGGGVYCQNSSSVAITNCTISGNSARYGGAVYCNWNSTLILTNSIIWGDTAKYSGDEIHLDDLTSSITITYSDIVPSSIDGPGTSSLDNNISALPLFVDPQLASESPTIAGNYHLQSGSPCIDAGNTVPPDFPENDIDGDFRLHGTRYDMGSDEFTPQCSVDIDCDDSNSCTADSCDQNSRICSYDPAPMNGQGCDDGLLCNDGEICNNGFCGGGTPLDCSGQNDQCNVGVCNEASGSCEKDPVPKNTQDCDDGQFCNDGETCSNGVCGGGQGKDCSDNNLCTEDVCDEITGCSNPPIVPCFEEFTDENNNPVFSLNIDGLEVFFRNLIQSGKTAVHDAGQVRPDGVPAFDVGYEIAGNYYEIMSTVVYGDTIEVCLKFDSAGLTNAQISAIVVMHYNEVTAEWEVTATDNPLPLPGDNEICGDVDNLSPFAPAVAPLDADEDRHERPADCDDGDSSIHPGADDVCEDGIDQDCEDGDAACPSSDAGTQATDSGGGCSVVTSVHNLSTESAIVNTLIFFFPLIVFGIIKYWRNRKA